VSGLDERFQADIAGLSDEYGAQAQFQIGDTSPALGLVDELPHKAGA